MTSGNGWSEARRILCVRLDNMGDVIMSAPALRALKRAAPRRKLTLLTSEAGAAASRLIPDVDDAIVYDAPWVKHEGTARDRGLYDHDLLRTLNARKFDAAVIFTVYSQNPLPAAYMCFLAGIPLRLAHCRENPYLLLTDWIRESEPEYGFRHEVQRQLDLVATVGATVDDDRIALAVPPDARTRALQLLAKAGIAPGVPWVTVHPGASAPSRRYPAHRFAEAITLLHRETGCTAVLTGTKAEGNLIESIRAQTRKTPSVSLAGKLNLEEFAALLSLSPLLISNNTGPVHIAAGTGTKVVDLYALTNPQHTPWRVRNRTLFHEVPCKYCYKSVCPERHHRCLSLVRPADVVRAATELLNDAAGESVSAGISSPAPVKTGTLRFRALHPAG